MSFACQNDEPHWVCEEFIPCRDNWRIRPTKKEKLHSGFHSICFSFLLMVYLFVSFSGKKHSLFFDTNILSMWWSLPMGRCHWESLSRYSKCPTRGPRRCYVSTSHWDAIRVHHTEMLCEYITQRCYALSTSHLKPGCERSFTKLKIPYHQHFGSIRLVLLYEVQGEEGHILQPRSLTHGPHSYLGEPLSSNKCLTSTCSNSGSNVYPHSLDMETSEWV